MRLSAAKVLSHPWLETNSTTELPSSTMFRLNNNAKHLNDFAESASAVNRVMLQHCSGKARNLYFCGKFSLIRSHFLIENKLLVNKKFKVCCYQNYGILLKSLRTLLFMIVMRCLIINPKLQDFVSK